MWFEILPSFLIITTAMAVPHGAAYVLNYLVLGNCYRRLLGTKEQRLQYLRDRRLADNPYKVLGLEVIPDEDDFCVEQNKRQKEECFEIIDKEEECKEE